MHAQVVPMFHANSWGLNFSGALLMLVSSEYSGQPRNIQDCAS
jgi:hypothetical protein